jgi:DNA-binding transcriptional LysR family regulator
VFLSVFLSCATKDVSFVVMVAVRIGRLAVGLYVAKTVVGNRRIRIDGIDSMRGLSLLAYTPQFRTLQKAKWFRPILESASIASRATALTRCWPRPRAGLGIAVLPRFVARRYDDLVPVSDNVSEPDLRLITHPESRRDPKVRVTADFLKNMAREPNGFGCAEMD